MAQRSKPRSRLPEWFTAERYTATNRLNALEWYEQLYVRGKALNILSAGNALWGPLQKLIELSRSNPLINIDEHDCRQIAPEIAIWKFRTDAARNFAAAVRPATAVDLFKTINAAYRNPRRSENRQKKITVFGKLVADPYDSTLFNETISEWAYQPLHFWSGVSPCHSEQLVRVDFNLPKAELMRQFETMLKEQRRWRRQKKAPLKLRDLRQELVSAAVLPYFDLKLWSLETGITIPASHIAEALSGHDNAVNEQSLRRTTASWIDGPKFDYALQSLLVEIPTVKKAG